MTREDKFVLFSIPNCVWCERAEALLKSRGEDYVILPGTRSGPYSEFIEAAGFTTMPQVFLGADYIGGFLALQAFLNGVTRDL